MKRLASFAALAACALAVSAQEPIGVLQNVSGTVSLSGQSMVSRASSGTPVMDGSSILVSSSGKATLVLNTGCSVSLGANQHLTINAKTPCEKITASVKHLFPAYQVAQAPVGSGLIPPPAGAGVTGAGTAGAGAGLGAAGAGTGLFAGVGAGTLAIGGGLALGVGAAIQNSNNDTPVSGQ